MSEPCLGAQSEDGAVGLWEFALDFYHREGVADACLKLQDLAGVDVNILIYALWRVLARHEQIVQRDIERADALVSDWRRDVVLPLRALRRALKSGPPPAPSAASEKLRGRIKAAELDAEHIELDTLEALVAPRASNQHHSDAVQRVGMAIACVVSHYGADRRNDAGDALAALVRTADATVNPSG